MTETDKVKIVTKITSFDDVQKSLQEVENKLNILIKSVNDVSEKETSETEGKSGDINITRNADGTYGLETCTNEGWKKMYVSNKTTAEGTSEVYLGDKPKIVTKLSTTESFTSSVDSRYLPSTPDFNSGWVWFDWSEHHWNGNHPAWKFAHTIESLPTLVTIQVAPGLTGNPTSGTDEALISDQSTITWFTEMNNHFGDSYGNNQVYGLTYKIDKDYVYVDGAEAQSGFISDYDGTNTSFVSFQDCSIRILLWK